MGDRTYVTVRLRKADYQYLIDKHFGGSEEKFDAEFSPSQTDFFGNVVDIGAEEINYGEWDEFEKFLYENGVEYDKRWEAGGDYSAGSKYFRMVAGKYQSVEIYETQEALLSFLQELETEKDPKKLRKKIKDRIKELCPFPIVDLNEVSNSADFIQELDQETKNKKKKKKKKKE